MILSPIASKLMNGGILPGNMCEHSRINFSCGHHRIVVLSWCDNYRRTGKVCPPNVVQSEPRSEGCGVHDCLGPSNTRRKLVKYPYKRVPGKESTSSSSNSEPPVPKTGASSSSFKSPIQKIDTSSSNLNPPIQKDSTSSFNSKPPTPKISTSSSDPKPPIPRVGTSYSKFEPPLQKVSTSSSSSKLLLQEVNASSSSFESPMQEVMIHKLSRILLISGELEHLYKEAIRDDQVDDWLFKKKLETLLELYSCNLEAKATTTKQTHMVLFMRHESGGIARSICREIQLNLLKDQGESFAGTNAQEVVHKNKGTTGSPYRPDMNSDPMNNFHTPEESLWFTQPLGTVDDGATPMHSIVRNRDEQLDSELKRTSSNNESVGSKGLGLQLLPESHEISHFLMSGTQFSTLVRSLREFLHPTLQSQIVSLSKYFKDRSSKDDSVLIEAFMSALCCVDVYGFDMSSTNDRQKSLLAVVQRFLEDKTQKTWDWWPLKSPQTIPEYQMCVKWRCKCGLEESKLLPEDFARALKQSFQQYHPEHGNTPNSASKQSTMRNNVQTEGNIARNKPPGRFDNTNSLRQTPNITYSTQNPRETLITPTAYVLFCVNGPDGLILKQIKMCESDKTFFQALCRQYYDGRGIVRSWLSLWKFSHCEFYKFEKFEEGIAALHVDMPSSAVDHYPDQQHDNEYQYTPKPLHPKPPVTPDEFYKKFYTYSRKRSIKHYFSRCNGRCCRVKGPAYVIERIPKRVSRIDDESENREIFWGIKAQEKVAFRVVLVYHVLGVTGPFIFFYLWLFYWDHESDLQGASIPFSMVLGILSSIWFPLLHK